MGICSIKRSRVVSVRSCSIVTLTRPQPYLAMSYVWGPQRRESVRLRSNVGAMLDMEHLPRTFKEVIQVTRALAYDYLWVDAICIDQDDPDDRSALVGRMDLIYRGASLAIVAASGCDADHGLSGISKREPDRLVKLQWNTWSIEAPSLHDALAKSVWSTRVWTFQEHVLSRACLYFREREVFFRSPKQIFRESLGHDREIEQGLMGCKWLASVQDQSFQRYAAAVKEYTCRNFTYRSDLSLIHI